MSGGALKGGHCLKVWTTKQQLVSLSTAESELYAEVKAAAEGLGVQSVARDLGRVCGLTLHVDASATMGLGIRRGLGRAKHVDMQSLWIQEASMSGRFDYEALDGLDEAFKQSSGSKFSTCPSGEC